MDHVQMALRDRLEDLVDLEVHRSKVHLDQVLVNIGLLEWYVLWANFFVYIYIFLTGEIDFKHALDCILVFI